MECKIKLTKNLNYKSSRNYDCSDLFRISKLCLLLILNVSVVHCLYDEYRKPTYLEGRVGSYVVFNCHIEFPQEDHPIPYILNWKREVSANLIQKIIFLESRYSNLLYVCSN